MDRLIAFVATAKPRESKAFYRDALGLRFVEETSFSLVFLSGEAMIRIQKVAEIVLAPDTAMGWEVDALDARVAELSDKGVVFELFEGIEQDSACIWAAPDGTRVAWFRDPDGNLLSLTQFAA